MPAGEVWRMKTRLKLEEVAWLAVTVDDATSGWKRSVGTFAGQILAPLIDSRRSFNQHSLTSL